MYLQHYGFTSDPFHITPDPRFFFLGSSHREAFASMVYGLKKRKGFIAVIGEVGLGKTTVVRSFLKLKSKQTELRTIFIFNPALTFRGLLQHIFEELEIELPLPKQPESDDTSELVKKLHNALIEEYSQGHLIVLVIDEAQNMPVETLENLRMLSNLETTQTKLLQIFLVGQPELERKLNRPELRQLKQRLAIRSTLKPLSKKETVHYIEHRLKKAGLHKQTLFTRRALRRINHYAKGNPRIINILCDNALVTGFGYGVFRIGPGIIKEVSKDILGDRRRTGKRTWGAAAAGIFFLVGGGFWYSPYADSVKRDFTQLPVVSQIRNGMAPFAASDTDGTKKQAENRKTRQETPPSPVSSKPEPDGKARTSRGTETPPVAPAPVSIGGGEGGGLSASLEWDRGTLPPGELNGGARERISPLAYKNSILTEKYDQEGQSIREGLMDRLRVFRDLSQVRQKVLVEMAKQTSIRGLMTFDRMIAALEEQNYLEAARQMIHSNWGDRVGLHAIRLAEVMYTGHPQGWDRPDLAVGESPSE